MPENSLVIDLILDITVNIIRNYTVYWIEYYMESANKIKC
jgi:hypothetical protein